MVIIVSDYFAPIKELAVENFRLVRRRFDYYGNDTEVNTYIKNSGTVVSATSTTLVLAAGASTVDGAYKDLRLKVESASGSVQARKILSYTGSTLTCVVYPFGSVPDATYTYEVIR